MIKHLFLFIILPVAAFGQTLLAPDNKLDNWKIQGPETCWALKNGILTGSSDPEKIGGILWSRAHYRDFTLTGEFRFSGNIDSGIFIRHEGDQIQIGISGSLKRDMTGSPYIPSRKGYPVEAEGVKDSLKTDAWNAFSLTVIGKRYTFHLNGKQVLNYTSETLIDEGPIGFQVHPGVEMKIDFRKLVVSTEKP